MRRAAISDRGPPLNLLQLFPHDEKCTFATGELITGAAASASATGLKVETAVDGVSLGAAVPALDAVQAPPAAKSASSLLSAAFWSFCCCFAQFLNYTKMYI